MRYFKRKFKTTQGVRLAIFLKRPYDWVRLKLEGQSILSHKYSYSLIGFGEYQGRYKIVNLIITQEMIDDIKKTI
jgi:hypothetical protein